MVFFNNAVNKKNKVTMYVSSTCGDCQAAKDFFSKNNIEVNYKNIEEKKFREELINEYERMAVPTILIGKEVILGFSENRKRITELLKLKK